MKQGYVVNLKHGLIVMLKVFFTSQQTSVLFNPLCASKFFQQPRTNTYVLDVLYPHPLYLHFSNQRRIYTSSYRFVCNQNIFMPATKDLYIHPSFTLQAANDIYTQLYKVNFYRCLTVGYIFFFGCSIIFINFWIPQK